MLTSIILNDDLSYPDNTEYYSPSESYPEYQFSHIASKINHVYDAVRECFLQAGLDVKNVGTSDWNPLGEYINNGDKVFLLCNFVYHKKPNETEKEFFGKCTHASIIRVLLDYVYIATGKNGIISFGNAPLQSCSWEQILLDSGAEYINDFYKRNSIDISARDLRLSINERNSLGKVTFSKERDNSQATLVNLGGNSLLDELYEKDKKVRFRVSDYNPDRIENFHGFNKHDYIISNEILISDVVLSVPKLKTHEKVGITVGLKGLVGCVGHKDCLAHHRLGPPKQNGDEYPDNGNWQVLVSRFHDFVYRKRYPKFFWPVFEIFDKNLQRIVRIIFKKIQFGAWFGNDTTWRMTIDLAHIMHHADRNGKMTQNLQRKHLVLIDGIISGEGDGPLSPVPVDSRTIIFSDNIAFGDFIACKLMGFDPYKIPLVYNAIEDRKLIGQDLAEMTCNINGCQIFSTDVKEVIGRPFVPPIGWKGYL